MYEQTRGSISGQSMCQCSGFDSGKLVLLAVIGEWKLYLLPCMARRGETPRGVFDSIARSSSAKWNRCRQQWPG